MSVVSQVILAEGHGAESSIAALGSETLVKLECCNHVVVLKTNRFFMIIIEGWGR